ncbi:MAG: PP2C family serine/threonine-protein phosphatase [Vicinamibacteria bacterium]
MSLVINPDPRSLWKSFPSDQGGAYPKTDEEAHHVEGFGRRLIGASKRGRSHAHVGSFRDDDFVVRADDRTGWHIVAVADGAGSAKCSRKGSSLAVGASVDFVSLELAGGAAESIELAVSDWLLDGLAVPSADTKRISDLLYRLLGGAAHEAVKAIQRECEAAKRPYRDYSTTLILAIHKRISGREFIAAYWVGDGGVGVFSKENETVKVLGDGDCGEFAGQTRFLDASMIQGKEIVDRLRFTAVETFTTLILMTDGVTDPKFETDKNLRDPVYWEKLWDELSLSFLGTDVSNPEAALLSWLNFDSPGNHDDRTIVVVS